MGNCVELSFQRTNVSKSSVFLDATYEGVKIYSSVRDATNAVGQGSREAWMLVYGWTDVVSQPIELVPGGKKQNTLCVAETFPVKQTGKETLRQVRVQGKLRVVAAYEIPTWKTIDQPRGGGRRSYVRTVDKSGHWILSEVVLEVPVPCPNGINTSNCLSPPEIFSGEHNVHTIEPESPPDIGVKPLQPPIFPVEPAGTSPDLTPLPETDSLKFLNREGLQDIQLPKRGAQGA
jgi:hypothetical protein